MYVYIYIYIKIHNRPPLPDCAGGAGDGGMQKKKTIKR